MGEVLLFRPRGKGRLGSRLFRFRGYLQGPVWLAVLYWAHPSAVPDWITALGWAVLIMGLGWRWWAVAAWLTPSARGNPESQRLLRQEGPYPYSRNPRYLGNLLMTLGSCLVAALPTYLPLFFLVWAAVHFPIVETEEAFLLERFGDEYASYCREVPRWFGRPHLSLVRQCRGLNWRSGWRAERQTQAGWLTLAAALELWRDWKCNLPLQPKILLLFVALWVAIEWSCWRQKHHPPGTT